MSAIPVWVIDVVDILAVAFIVYRLLVLTRGTRAAQMLLGLLLIVGISLIAEWAHLNGLNWLFSNLRTVWVIAFVILFQPELRRALAQFGQNPVLRFFIRFENETEATGEVIAAARSMSRKRQGALIVLSREASLRPYIETGKRIEGRVSAELLETIFSPKGPLHDGAVILRDDQIVAAGCVLPLTDNPAIPPTYGTRHRAALGLSEETDAVVVVVSEETGDISIAHQGELKKLERAEELGPSLAELPRGE